MGLLLRLHGGFACITNTIVISEFPSCRHVLVFMAFLGFVNVYALRVNLSVAIVSMVNTTQPEKNHTIEDECPHHGNDTSGDDSQVCFIDTLDLI